MNKNSYIERSVDSFLEDWKLNPAHKPLIIKGARQIGKTAAIEHFAQTHYKNFIEINFVREPEFSKITNDGFSVETILRNITLLRPDYKFVPGETLIFFDEVIAKPSSVEHSGDSVA